MAKDPIFHEWIKNMKLIFNEWNELNISFIFLIHEWNWGPLSYFTSGRMGYIINTTTLIHFWLETDNWNTEVKISNRDRHEIVFTLCSFTKLQFNLKAKAMNKLQISFSNSVASPKTAFERLSSNTFYVKPQIFFSAEWCINPYTTLQICRVEYEYIVNLIFHTYEVI